MSHAAPRTRGRGRPRRIGADLSVVVLVLVVIAAVAGVPLPLAPPAAGTPLADTGAPITVAGGSTGGRSTSPRASTGAVMPLRSPNAVDGLTGERVYSQRAGSAISARWSYVPGGSVVNARIDSWLRERFAEYAGAVGRAWPDEPLAGAPPGGMREEDRGCRRGSSIRPVAELLADPAEVPPVDPGGSVLIITCDVVVSTGTVIGIRMRASEVRVAGGASELMSETIRTFYADVATGESAAGEELFTSERADRVLDALRVALRSVARAPGGVDESGDRPDLVPGASWRAVLADATPTRAGGLLVRVPAELLTAGSSAVEIRLGPAQFSAALTAFGSSVRAAADDGGPWVGARDTGLPTRTPCDLVACLALTFDDGPGPYTDRVLDTLGENGATATFFLQGEHVDAMPEVVRRMVAEGHDLGNHTYSHIYLLITPIEQVRAEIERTDAAVERAAGVTPAYLRPPWGAYDPTLVDEYGKPIVLWQVNTLDWMDLGAAAVSRRVLATASPGSIMLLHDVHEDTAVAMTTAVPELQSRGFRLVGLEDLIGSDPRLPVTRSGVGGGSTFADTLPPA